MDSTHPDWSKSWVRLPSVINAANLTTVAGSVTHVIGRLFCGTQRKIGDCLRRGFGPHECTGDAGTVCVDPILAAEALADVLALPQIARDWPRSSCPRQTKW